MARPRAPKIETRNARLALPIRRKPFFTTISRGIALGYRRNVGAGSWVVRSITGGEWTKAFAIADDHEPANGNSVLSWSQAIDRARQLARGCDHDSNNGDRPLTVAEAVDDYETALKADGGDVRNASRVRGHLPPSLASKTVSLLTAKELTAWRAGLIDKGLTPAAADRTGRVLKAALAMCAKGDKRIANQDAWREGLKRLKDTHNPRNVILPDAVVLKIVPEAYKISPQFGLLIHVAAETGARASQIVRLDVADLVTGHKPRVLMPSSAKGKKKPRREPVPIPASLAAALKAAARGRPDDARLLTDENGERWTGIDVARFREITAKLKLAHNVVPYSLRHSSIVRQLKRNVPVRVVAAHHDTSVAEIERTYSKYILADADELTRAALLDVSPKAVPDNVVSIAGARS